MPCRCCTALKACFPLSIFFPGSPYLANPGCHWKNSTGKILSITDQATSFAAMSAVNRGALLPSSGRVHSDTVTSGDVRTDVAGDVIRVVIIGAGIAGIAAAHELLVTGARKKGDEKKVHVTLLEARDRIGGRIYSKYGRLANGNNTGPVEMGAQWIQTYVGNPIYEEAKRFGIATKIDTGEEEEYFSANGRKKSDDEVDREENEFEKFLDRAQRKMEGRNRDLPLELGLKIYDEKKFKKPSIQWHLAQEVEDEYGGKLSELSCWYFDDDEEYDGSDMLIPGGFAQIPQRLLDETLEAAKSEGSLEVVYSSPVTDIEYSRISDPNGHNEELCCRVHTSTGRDFRSHYVIVTVPLGVLKSNSMHFTPPLSERKTRSIERIGFGHVNKVILFFDEVTWPQDVEFFGVEDESDRGRFPGWVNLWPTWGIPALQSAGCGAFGERMMTMNENEIVDIAMSKVRLFAPQMKPDTRPIDVWLHMWGTDPYALGSYSFAKVGCTAKKDRCVDFGIVAEPEWPLLFAGEHTCGDYRGSVHGAYLSGRIAARKLTKAL